MRIDNIVISIFQYIIIIEKNHLLKFNIYILSNLFPFFDEIILVLISLMKII